MKTTKESLISEKEELDKRRNALAEASNQEGAFQALGNEQQGLLLQQRDAMDKYSVALGERIRTFQDIPAPEQSNEAPEANPRKERAAVKEEEAAKPHSVKHRK